MGIQLRYVYKLMSYKIKMYSKLTENSGYESARELFINNVSFQYVY